MILVLTSLRKQLTSLFFSFQVLSFPGPVFLPPGCWNIFSLKLTVQGILLDLLTSVFLTTNTGAIFVIPLQIFSAPTKVLRTPHVRSCHLVVTVACVPLCLAFLLPQLASSSKLSNLTSPSLSQMIDLFR